MRRPSNTTRGQVKRCARGAKKGPALASKRSKGFTAAMLCCEMEMPAPIITAQSGQPPDCQSVRIANCLESVPERC